MQLSLLSSHDSRREARYKVLLRGRMHAGGLPSEICVRDISRRGLLVQAAKAPEHGTVVEVVVGRRSIIGRVRWAKQRRFGIELSPPISVDGLLADALGGSTAEEPFAPEARRPKRVRMHDSDAARRQASQMQFAAIAVLPLVAALWIGSLAHEAATKSSQTIASSLRRGEGGR